MNSLNKKNTWMCQVSYVWSRDWLHLLIRESYSDFDRVTHSSAKVPRVWKSSVVDDLAVPDKWAARRGREVFPCNSHHRLKVWLVRLQSVHFLELSWPWPKTQPLVDKLRSWKGILPWPREVLSRPVEKTKIDSSSGRDGSEFVVKDSEAWDSREKVFCREEISFTC